MKYNRLSGRSGQPTQRKVRIGSFILLTKSLSQERRPCSPSRHTEKFCRHWESTYFSFRRESQLYTTYMRNKKNCWIPFSAFLSSQRCWSTAVIWHPWIWHLKSTTCHHIHFSILWEVKSVRDCTKVFINCGSYLQKKMPLKNTALKICSVLDPVTKGTRTALELFLKIPSVTILVPSEEKESFMREAGLYNTDHLLYWCASGWVVGSSWHSTAPHPDNSGKASSQLLLWPHRLGFFRRHWGHYGWGQGQDRYGHFCSNAVCEILPVSEEEKCCGLLCKMWPTKEKHGIKTGNNKQKRRGNWRWKRRLWELKSKKVPSKKQVKENLLGGTKRAKAPLSQVHVSAATPVFTTPLTYSTNPPPASADIDQEQMAMDTEDVQKEMQKVKKQSSTASFFKT